MCELEKPGLEIAFPMVMVYTNPLTGAQIGIKLA